MLAYRGIGIGFGLMAALMSGCASRPANPTGERVQPSVHTSIPSRYQVRQGDTISGIAARYGLDWRELSARNNLGDNHIIYVGQWIDLLPKTTQTVSAAPVAKAAPISLQTLPSSTSSVPVAPPVSSGFILPVGQGGVIARGYGLPSGSDVTSGVFFSGQAGTPILASAAGTVIHSDAMIGSSRQRPMVMIQHAGGYVTTYFDVNNITVQNGQNLNQGDRLGLMASQISSGAALFEFRLSYNGRYVDPIKMIQ